MAELCLIAALGVSGIATMFQLTEQAINLAIKGLKLTIKRGKNAYTHRRGHTIRNDIEEVSEA